MPLVCLSCRHLLERDRESRAGHCPECGGEMVAATGAWISWSGPESRGQLLLGEGEISIGRRSSNQVVLEDVQASRLHASLHRTTDGWQLRDRDSQNGTLLNGNPVHRSLLSDGDVIAIGKHQIHFHHEASPGQADVTIVPRPEPADLACLEMQEGDFPAESQIKGDQPLRENYRRLRTAYQFLSYMGRENDEQKLLENILRFAFEMVPAERGAVLLRQEEGSPLAPAARLCRDESQAALVIPDSILRLAVDKRQAVLSADAMLDERFRQAASVIQGRVKSAMCVPLLGRHEVLGAIHLDTSRRSGAFQLKDLQMLSTIAGQAAALLEQSRLHRLVRQEATRRESLSRFLSRELVGEVMRQGLSLSGEARSGPVSVLFCDIRGFCSLSENLPPEKLLRLLNNFFRIMSNAVFRHQGMLDKFIGDAVMAVWGAPIRRGGDAGRAFAAGRQMLEAVEASNRLSTEEGWRPIEIGVGLHHGEAMIGAVGSPLRMEYTVMGDTVNLAARICELAGPGQFLASAEAVAAAAESGAPPKVERQPSARVRGRSRPVHLYRVLGA